MLHADLTERIIGAAVDVHRELGPGLLESTYEACLAYVLTAEGLHVERQKQLPVHFRGVMIDCGYRIDLVVDQRILIELKAVDELIKVHEAQVLTYLKLSGLRVGLLMNFNVTRLLDGFKRFVL
jgi:GxxExxY protein